jgi:hypothetical protein
MQVLHEEEWDEDEEVEESEESAKPFWKDALQRHKKARADLATHRRNRKDWRGNQEGYRDKERQLVGVVLYYRELLREPEYQRRIRKACNKKRRVKPRRPARKVEIFKPAPPRDPNAPLWVNASRRDYWDEHEGHLPWMIFQIRRKSFKTKQQLANRYRRKLKWVETALAQAVASRMITEEELKNCFRKQGRPRKGKKRGPYKQRAKSHT